MAANSHRGKVFSIANLLLYFRNQPFRQQAPPLSCISPEAQSYAPGSTPGGRPCMCPRGSYAPSRSGIPRSVPLHLRGDPGPHFPARVIPQGCQLIVYRESTDHPLYLLRLIGYRIPATRIGGNPERIGDIPGFARFQISLGDIIATVKPDPCQDQHS